MTDAIRNTNLDVLPPLVWTYVESENMVAMIKRGESGYYPVGGKDNADENRALVADQNKSLGVKPSEVMAMEFGSMFGWDKPGANPVKHMSLDLIADLNEVDPALGEEARKMKVTGSTYDEIMVRFRNIFEQAKAARIAAGMPV